MAQRLATEYVKASLKLRESELLDFERLLAEHGIVFHVKVLDNGTQVIDLSERSESDIVFAFERRGLEYVFEGSFRVNTAPLANLLRRAVNKYKGNAIVNRIYANFTMIYYYELGSVVKIVELTEHHRKVIYEFKDTTGRLEQLFNSTHIEGQIADIHDQINTLLDERNDIKDSELLQSIDRTLSELTHRLFVLEA